MRPQSRTGTPWDWDPACSSGSGRAAARGVDPVNQCVSPLCTAALSLGLRLPGCRMGRASCPEQALLESPASPSANHLGPGPASHPPPPSTPSHPHQRQHLAEAGIPRGWLLQAALTMLPTQFPETPPSLPCQPASPAATPPPLPSPGAPGSSKSGAMGERRRSANPGAQAHQPCPSGEK